MNSFFGWIGRAYDALNNSTRRRQVVTDTRQEDKLLLPLDRDRLISQARSLRRNASIAAWAIRKHLDYVSTFNFQCRIKEDRWPQARQLNARIEELFDWWSRPLNCDVSGRYSLPRLIRMLEGLRTVDGDAFVLLLSQGTVQIIEGDRVRNPTDFADYAGSYDPDDYIHGVQVTDTLAPRRYAVCDRSGLSNAFVLRDIVQAKYVIPHGFYDRIDQIRGVSPLSSALTTLFDVYEAQEYALAKMKLSQLFCLRYKHGTPSEDEGTPLKFDFGSGPQMIELDPDDDASFMETNSPSSEFQAFMSVGIACCCKALDLPYSFFDESHTNYSGARQAMLQYQLSAEQKRNDLRQVLNRLTIWRLQLFIMDGVLTLPDGMTLDDVVFEWIGTGTDWIDPLREVQADTIAVKSAFKSRQMICKEDGKDFYSIVDQIAAENRYLAEKGLSTDIENVTLPPEAYGQPPGNN